MKAKEKDLVVKRRDALKMIGMGSFGMLSGGFSDIMAIDSKKDINPIPKARPAESRSSISFTTGTDRKEMLYEIIKPFESEIKAGLKKKQLIIKPNMVVTNTPLCATHVDALRALLEYLKPIYKGQVIIAESSSSVNSAEGFKAYGYLDLANEYNVKFIDINTFSKGTQVNIIDRNLHLDPIQASDLLTSPDNYVISISRLKTHNSVVMTGAVKNLTMGAPLNPGAVNGAKPISYKRNMHAGGSRWLHYNIFLMAPYVLPDFSIIDGVEGMEGNGPISGTPIDHRIAMAGFDAVAVDSMCARLMDIPLENVGYLNYCAAGGLGNVERDKIDIIGGKVPEQYVKTYKLGSNIASQLQWKDPLNLQQGTGSGQRPANAPAATPGQPGTPPTTPQNKQ